MVSYSSEFEYDLEDLDDAALMAIENEQQQPSTSSESRLSSTNKLQSLPAPPPQALNRFPTIKPSNPGSGKFRPASISNQNVDSLKTNASASTSAKLPLPPPNRSTSTSKPKITEPQVVEDLFDDGWDAEMMEEMEKQVNEGKGKGRNGGEGEVNRSNNAGSGTSSMRNGGTLKGNGRAGGLNSKGSYKVGGAGPSTSSTTSKFNSTSSTTNPTTARSIYNEKSNNTKGQLDLFGKSVPPPPPSKLQLPSNSSNAVSSGNALSPSSRSKNTKSWDPNKLGRKASGGSEKESRSKGKGKAKDNGKGKGKGKARRSDDDLVTEDEDDDHSNNLDSIANEEDEWDLPAPPPDPWIVTSKASTSKNFTKPQIDPEACKTWIYPTNMEKRDYQFNIVALSLFNNVLVSLPTGLGKTFIAAVIVLNYFRWYPTGKLIFLCPSRPLVAQQQIACHRICGLPWECAVDLTGGKHVSVREADWKEKRIFYMTPQTLENDLRNGKCDPLEIITIVVDEAHRATGNYSYCNVVKLVTNKNPNFRLLALSATPGSTVDKVQEVIDNLHISKVEIRTEESLDTYQYVHKKKEEEITVYFEDELLTVREQWSKLMKNYLDPVIAAGLLWNPNPLYLKSFTCQSIASDPKNREVFATKGWLRGHLHSLQSMAAAMQGLNGMSVNGFLEYVLEKSKSAPSSNGKQTKKGSVVSDSNSTFREMKANLLRLQDRNGKIAHPKMKKLFEVLENHFSEHMGKELELEEARENSGNGLDGNPLSTDAPRGEVGGIGTRAMVFCSSRPVVIEIVEYLKECGLSPAQFVGQASDVKGRSGMRQKDQQKAIADFRDGKYDCLVATQIGEEGLDIGEIDLIVCYEAPKDPIRMLQRVGRTGRKRAGKVIILSSEGPDEGNFKKSKNAYKEIQKGITSGNALELYSDVPRLVPDWITPECEERAVEQPNFNPDLLVRKPSRARKDKETTEKEKKAKIKDPKRNIPESGAKGFVKASDFRRRKIREVELEEEEEIESARLRETLDRDAQEDSDDELLDRGISFSGNYTAKKNSKKVVKESKSSGTASSKVKGKAQASTSKASAPTAKSKPKSFNLLPEAVKLSTPNQEPIEISDDPDDEVIVKKQKLSSSKSGPSIRSSNTKAKSPARPQSPLSVNDSDDDRYSMGWLPNSDQMEMLEKDQMQRQSKTISLSPSIESPKKVVRGAPHPLFAQLAAGISNEQVGQSDNEMENEDPEGASELELEKEESKSPPKPSLKAVMNGFDEVNDFDEEEIGEDELLALEEAERCQKEREEAQVHGPLVLAPSSSPIVAEPQLLPDEGGDDEDSPMPIAGRNKGKGRAPDTATSISETASVPRPRVSSGNMIDESPMPLAVRKRKAASRPQIQDSSSPLGADADKEKMGPPSVEPRKRFIRASELLKEDSDEDSDEVLARGKGKSKSTSKDPKSKKRKESTKTESKSKSKTKDDQVKTKKRRKKQIGNSPTSRLLFQNEAERSTDEERHGEGDENDEGLSSDEEDELDRAFVNNFEPTQATKGYNQQAVYAQSLFTQPGPNPFGRSRSNQFYGGKYGIQNTPGGSRVQDRWAGVQATPNHPDDSSDRYSQDSFVAGDEEEIEYMGDSGPGTSQL